MFPTEVNDDGVRALVLLYERATGEMLAELDGATDFGRANRLAIIQRINQRLAVLGVASDDWAQQHISEAYKAGMMDAVKQLNFIGANVTTAGFTAINERALKALIDDASLSFGDSMQAAGRSTRGILNAAVQRQIRESIAAKQIQGATRKEITKTVKQAIAEQGITGLKDRAGRNWTLQRYAEMLARTKIVEARNTGLGNKMLENGYDVVEVSDHASTHQACAIWEGKFLSLTGATKSFEGKAISTVEAAKAAGLFHPHCRHAINAVANAELARTLYKYDKPNSSFGSAKYKTGI